MVYAMRTNYWFEEYLGTPWSRTPEPPYSFNCGELARYIYKKHLNIDSPLICADAGDIRQRWENMADLDKYELLPVKGDIQEFDLAFIMHRVRRDHLGIATKTKEGLMILHCISPTTRLESIPDIMGMGCRGIEWRRHKLCQK